MAAKFLSFSRQRSEEGRDQVQPPMLFRIFAGTLQRQIPEYTSLNTHAAYLIVLDEEAQIVAWIGTLCSELDRTHAFQAAKEIMLRDFGENITEDIPTVYENDELDELVEAVLETLNCDYDTYISKSVAADRKEDIENETVSVGKLVPAARKPGEFEMQEVSFGHPNADGSVPRVDFVPIERDTLAYIIIGRQYDLWIARGVDETIQQQAVAFMERLIDRDVFGEVALVMDRSRFLHHLQVVFQGEERYAFRRPLKLFTNFEPVGRTVPNKPEANANNAPPPLSLHAPSTTPTTAAAGGGLTPPSAMKGADKEAPRNKKGTIPVTFSEFRLEHEETANGLHATETMDERGFRAHLGRPNLVNFWIDVKPPQASRNVLYGRYVPQDEDYASPVKLRMAAGDKQALDSVHFNIMEHENLSLTDRKDLLMRSKHNPGELLGWQIEIDEGLHAGVYVIINHRKSLWRKTLFQLVDIQGNDFWLRLRRGHAKRGLVFRPLRQVARIGPARDTLPAVTVAATTSDVAKYHAVGDVSAGQEEDDMGSEDSPLDVEKSGSRFGADSFFALRDDQHV